MRSKDLFHNRARLIEQSSARGSFPHSSGYNTADLPPMDNRPAQAENDISLHEPYHAGDVEVCTRAFGAFGAVMNME
jgi:hypothetical protein